MNYGKKLKELRLNNNLTQEQIAQKLDIAQITYSHYEIQEKIIPLERLNTLCNIFDVSLDYIFELNDSKNYQENNKEIDIIKNTKRLKEFRKENKLTQKKLATILNTVAPVICNYEKGKHLIATPFLYEICKKYHISADYLLGKTNTPKYIKQ